MSVHCVYCGQFNDSASLVCGACGRRLPPPQNQPVPDPTDPASWPPSSDPQHGTGNPYTTFGADPASYPPPSPQYQNPIPGGDQSASSWSPGYAPVAPPPQSWQAPPQPWQPAPYGTPAPGVWQPAYGQQQLHPDAVNARSKARTSMILGIVGLFCFSIVFGPIALSLGIKSRATLQRYGIEDGQGMAMAGIVMGTVDIVLSILYFMALLANLGK